jgi:hypothetical protein
MLLLIEAITPIGSVKEFIAQVGRCVSRADKPCDPMGLLLAGANVIVDVASTAFVLAKAGAVAFKGFKPLYKAGIGIERTLEIAKKSGQFLGETASEVGLIFRELSQEAMSRGARSFEAVQSRVTEAIGRNIQKTSTCLQQCSGKLELVFRNLKKTFNDVKLGAARKIEEFLEALNQRFGLRCVLAQAAVIINSDTLMDLGSIAILSFGVFLPSDPDSSQPNGAMVRPQAATSTNKCPEEQLRVNMNSKTTPLTNEAKNRINSKYGGAITDDIYEDIPDADWNKGSRSTKPDQTSPHHIVAKKEKARTICIDSSGVDVCQGNRDILDRYGMNYNDGCNGSFLPYSKKSKLYSTFPSAQIHDRKDFHNLKYYSRLFEILTAAEDDWNDPNNFVPVADRKAKLCEELQVISYRLLTGQFYGNALR